MNTPITLDFFLGANSPNGFYSYFSEITDPEKIRETYLIKGGAGTGKSGMMKKIAAECAGQDELIEKIHCSSDPDSLDGVIFHSSKKAIVDATPPHALEPQFPGAFETPINLCDFWDTTHLRSNREYIIKTAVNNTKLHSRCCRFLKAAATLIGDNYIIATDVTDYAKLLKYSTHLADKVIPKKKVKQALEHKRMISAVTPKGIVCYSDTIKTLCDKTYTLKDDFGVCSNFILNKLREVALAKGYEIYCCYCPLNPTQKLEHIMIPELHLAFVTQTKYYTMDVQPYRVVNFTRFTNIEKLKTKKQRISFNRRASVELLQEAVKTLNQAKQNHDVLESFYTPAIDFNKVNKKTSAVIDMIMQ